MNRISNLEVSAKRGPYETEGTKRPGYLAAPNTEKDFKKIMDDEREGGGGAQSEGMSDRVSKSEEKVPVREEQAASAERPVPEKRLASLFDLPRPSPAIKKEASTSTGMTSSAKKDLSLFAGAEIAGGEDLPTPSAGYAAAKNFPAEEQPMQPALTSKDDKQLTPKGKEVAAEIPKAPQTFAQGGVVAKSVEGEHPSVDVPQKGKLLDLPEMPKGEVQVAAKASKETATLATPMSELKALLAAAKEEKAGASSPFDAMADSSRASQAGKLASRQEEAVATVNEPMAKGAKEVGLEKKPVTLKKDEESLSMFAAPAKNDKEGMAKGDDPNTPFAKEQMDLSVANSGAMGRPSVEVQSMTAVAAPTPAPTARANVRELVNHIVKTLEVLEMSGKTETVVVLKNPPIFEGARVVITGFESARKDVHIAFENLSNGAQHLIDLQANRAQLLNSLEREGYNVRVFTSTTSDVPRLVTGGSDLPDREQSDPRDREHQEEQKRQQQRQKNQA